MRLKFWLFRILDGFLYRNRWLIFLFLDNNAIRYIFLDKYLCNRPELFRAYYAWKPVWGRPGKILILKTDAIGDYLLFRNYLEEMALHFRPMGYRMVLAGNQAWKELALQLDSGFIDEFVWLDRGGMNRKPSPEKQLEFLRQINRYSYSRLLYPNFSREWEAGDWLVKHIPSKEKYAFDGNVVNQTIEQHREGNFFYTRLIEPERQGKFDFYRNGEIVSAFTGKNSLMEAPRIAFNQSSENKKPYAVFFPGASFESRRWPEESFSQLGELIFTHLGTKVKLAGGPGESVLCGMIAQANPAVFENLAGKTSLPELLELISNSSLLISNDTSAIHMGAQSGVPSICIYKGNNYGRCMPYPEGLLSNFRICMPEQLKSMPPEERIRRFSENDGLDIRTISVDQVWEATLLILTKIGKWKS